jgi:glutathione synthase/RimK-type ligase-like ATP-grasp enzyme
VSAPRYVLVANPGTKRCEAYRRALGEHWAGTADIEIVPWAEIAACQGDLRTLSAFDRPAVVRLESPGKDKNVYRQFLHLADPGGNWHSCDYPKGLILRPGLWYRGFEHILQGLQRSFDERPHLRPTARPRDIAVMFDKLETSKRLRAAEVPVPDWLDSLDDPFSRYWPSTYLKLRYSSSASGIIAFRTTAHSDGFTTIANFEGNYFNSRLVRQVQGVELFAAIDFLNAEGAMAQQGIPMAQIDGMNFDLRVVCLYGKPAATIFRLSRYPITNLHLGGIRGDSGRCRAAIPNRSWLDAMDHAEAAAGQFDSAVVGIDLVFERGRYRSFILEANAFGDFFAWWADAEGRSLQRLEIEATASRAHRSESGDWIGGGISIA